MASCSGLRIVFFGATELGHRCCRELLTMGEKMVGIFSIPEHFRISYSVTPVHNRTFRSFEDLSAAAEVPLHYVTGNMRDQEYESALRDMAPDLGLAVGWYYLIPPTIRRLFPKGVAGIHASLLPRYRGGAPLVWAMIRGERQTGVSLFYLDDGVDTGDLVGQKPIPIGPDEGIGTVYDRAAEASVDLIRRYIPLIRTGTAPRLAQDHDKATVFPQRSPPDGRIDWAAHSAQQVHDWVRAQSRPYPGAFAELNGRRITVWGAVVCSAPVRTDPSPGLISVEQGRGPTVICADGLSVEILEAQPDRGPSMTGPALVSAASLSAGMRFDLVPRAPTSSPAR